MQKITAITNKTKNGFTIPSKYNRGILFDWFKKYKKFHITPDIKESIPSRRYLEGGVMPAYCEWQYGIDARARGRNEQRRYLFKKDFNYEIVNDRKGNPVRSPISSKGMSATLSDRYTKWAEQNGAPIPNPKLYKLWRDKYKTDELPTFFDFLDFLDIECDAFPTPQDFEKLKTIYDDTPIEYPKEDIDTNKTPF